MRNFLRIKCTRCNDILTEGELRTHDFKPLGSMVVCYQCSCLEVEEAKKRYQERKVQEHMEKVEDQGYRWGEEKGAKNDS